MICAAVSQEQFAKAMKSIENKFVEMERSTSVREMAHSANLLAQVCDVNRGLLSGNKVVFDEDGSYIQNKATGEITMLEENAGMYELVMWVKRKDF